MPRPTAILRIPQPCAESWDAMTPTGPGRHCAACQKVVVDFTAKTDAEILAYLAQATGTSLCGRTWGHQLARPLVAAAPPEPAPRWRTWLVAALALWGLREGMGTPAGARPPVGRAAHQKPRRPAPAIVTTKRLVSGTVRNSATHLPLPGVAVFLQGLNRATRTDSAGHFSLVVPAGQRRRTPPALVLHFAGFHSQTVVVPGSAKAAAALQIALLPDPAAAGVEVIGIGSPSSNRTIIMGMMPLPGSTTMPASERSAKPKPKAGVWRWLTRPFRW